MFKPGDEIVKFRLSGPAGELTIPIGTVVIVDRVVGPYGDDVGLKILGWPDHGLGHLASTFRKVQRKNSRLTLEAFFTVPGGFEEPKRAPAKKKTDA